ncbi:3-isopropylmalate/(R)-2-methylmalate dehydratase small subunit [Geomicrobium halophilum]|uniref:3-isopropylmalate dehydratase small subunit n=1 Tax=Geomicrobium halophilum TaxID=549000 RepID=A0A841PVS4_9BACL|nr:3-isopropylmalate dehydratase small subunit [Geomicrobium halophilum]MBB6448323.1 3-isopropylmalate/(R)-2-methylmalate dehydratase small subunit [Geomicrobium halophilum]
MEAFREHRGSVASLPYVNVDTDQIIPKQFLKRVERTGFGQFLFYNWRFLDGDSKNPDFPLNQPHMEGASILISDHNFGCGSSREHAAWALQDYGFKVIIAPSFGDIFYNNSFKNGLLPLRMPEDIVHSWLEKGKESTFQLRVNLEEQTIEDEEGAHHSFDIDPYWKNMLIYGLDEIGITLQYEDYLKEYEAAK